MDSSLNNKHLLSGYYVPTNVQGTGNRTVNKINKAFLSSQAYILVGGDR